MLGHDFNSWGVETRRGEIPPLRRCVACRAAVLRWRACSAICSRRCGSCGNPFLKASPAGKHAATNSSTRAHVIGHAHVIGCVETRRGSIPPLRRCVSCRAAVLRWRACSAICSRRCGSCGNPFLKASPAGKHAATNSSTRAHVIGHAHVIGCVETRRGSIPPLRRCVSCRAAVLRWRACSAICSSRCGSCGNPI